MREMGLVSIRQSAKKLYEDESRRYKNHLNQEFDTTKPNEVWVSDVTYFKYGKAVDDVTEDSVELESVSDIDDRDGSSSLSFP